MKGLKVLFIAFFFLFSSSLADESSSDESIDLDNLSSKEAKTVVQFLQAVITLGYEIDKLKVISKIVEKFSEDPETGNITLVGSQNVYNEDGTIKEVRIIELAIPQLQKKSDADNDDNTAFDSDDFGKIKEVREIIETMSLVGLNSELIYLDYDKHGKVESGVYINKDTLALKFVTSTYVNKTIEVANRQVVEESLKNLKQGNIPEAKLYFDKDGNFVNDGSTVVVEQLATVASSWGDPSPETIETVLEAVVQVALETKSKDEVPNKLQAYLEEKSPNTTFIVASNEPSGYYMNRDFSLTVSNDLVEFIDYTTYTIFGYTPTDS